MNSLNTGTKADTSVRPTWLACLTDFQAYKLFLKISVSQGGHLERNTQVGYYHILYSPATANTDINMTRLQEKERELQFSVLDYNLSEICQCSAWKGTVNRLLNM